MSLSHSPGKGSFVLQASQIARAHTILAFSAFGSALTLGLLLHYKKIVRNDVAQYPEEWFPSVSSTIGDWYPERNIFQILIALTAGPRFCLVAFQYLLQCSSKSSLPGVVFTAGLLRTLSCGGWVYITSSDDHDVHDLCMILYIVLNIPWMAGGIALTPREYASIRRYRIITASTFFFSLVPLIYFFIQHKVHRVPGAYTSYSFFEWGLIFLDVLYDSYAEQEFKRAGFEISLGSVAGFQRPSTAPHEHNDFLEFAKEEPKPVSESQPPWRLILALTSDLYLSYIFWSIFTSLVPTIFYFSVWELGISGAEGGFSAVLSPIFLSIPLVRRWVATQGGILTLHLLSFSGLLAFTLSSPIHRLLVVTPASAIAVIRQVVDWRLHPVYSSLMTSLGFILSSLSKHANHSNNPVWPIVNENSGGWNKIGITLAILALADLYTRPVSARPPFERERLKIPQGNFLAAALPLGSLLFTFHNVLSESSTLVSWSWTGYENGNPRGPLPNLYSPLTLIAQTLGVLISVTLIQRRAAHILSHPLWFLLGSTGAYGMYRYRNWLGYTASLIFAVFSMSITTPIVFKASRARSVTRTYFTALFVYFFLSLAAVWTVAYAFVPGGFYLRERTDLVTLASVLCFASAFRWPKINQLRHPISKLSAPVVSFTRTILIFVSVAALVATLCHLPSTATPHRPDARIFRAGIWTVHFGIDLEGRDSQRRLRTLIKDMELDVVGLLETDLHRPAYGNRDLTRIVAEDLGYYVDQGPGPNLHTWGAVLLSKFPIINSTHHLLPSPDGELAPAIEAVLDVFGTPVVVVVAHNGQEETPLDRELQSQELGRILASHQPNPAIFLGYIVSVPKAPKPNPYAYFIEDGNMFDVDEDDWDRWCEYIFYRGLYRTGYARVSRSNVTDTELQIGQFVVPQIGHTVTNDTREARYLRSFKETLPQVHWFPDAYYGNDDNGGVNGHYYHVFNTPLYYDLPQGAL